MTAPETWTTGSAARTALMAGRAAGLGAIHVTYRTWRGRYRVAAAISFGASFLAVRNTIILPCSFIGRRNYSGTGRLLAASAAHILLVVPQTSRVTAHFSSDRNAEHGS